MWSYFLDYQAMHKGKTKYFKTPPGFKKNLSAREADVLALIFGFPSGKFYGSNRYIAESVGLNTDRSVRRLIASLRTKGLIITEEKKSKGKKGGTDRYIKATAKAHALADITVPLLPIPASFYNVAAKTLSVMPSSLSERGYMSLTTASDFQTKSFSETLRNKCGPSWILERTFLTGILIIDRTVCPPNRIKSFKIGSKKLWHVASNESGRFKVFKYLWDENAVEAESFVQWPVYVDYEYIGEPLRNWLEWHLRYMEPWTLLERLKDAIQAIYPEEFDEDKCDDDERAWGAWRRPECQNQQDSHMRYSHGLALHMDFFEKTLPEEQRAKDHCVNHNFVFDVSPDYITCYADDRWADAHS
ncbi:helix-turn-helix domain-containing protein [Sansalvadorimonas sp. 2012CJ34-2]|uniref:Helix-turn-helix domain-containing protein n=1 Tax=Parendozoicomonas callyspongiae TaxID=2942213 RepID=A0ABT0PK88_9GAMM|nr:helix-turn-helix domain-containing protein [Sansalvadorimonas sp. 2012CJ34-2]MCL6271788.1 helix-turn-helix domain-containing protein [Sansalvadorimonas sp. 2012CJ34-2]